MIYVTHDQIEAMTLADRIVLMRDGLIEQVGSPLDLFERPASRFVAGFLGSPKMSFVPGVLAQRGGAAAILVKGLDRALAAAARVLRRRCPTARPSSSASARSISAAPARPTARRGWKRIKAEIELLQPTGSRTFATFRLGDTPVLAELQAHDAGSVGETIALDLNLQRASVFDAATERAV